MIDNSKKQKRVGMIVCITGMHRSGTSLTANWLEQCGLHFFDKLGPSFANKMGHFEDHRIVNFHERMILQRFAKSKGWIIPRKKRIETEDFEKHEALEILKDRGQNKCWGWKDPRAALFLDLWEEVSEHIVFLMIWRPFNDVVDSLMRRSSKAPKSKKKLKISKSDSISNWIVYNKHLLDFKTHNPEAILIGLNSLLENDAGVVKHLKDNFDIPLNRIPISQVYKPDLITDTVSSYYPIFSRDIKELESLLQRYSDW